MRRLILLRHGQAAGATDGDDFHRSLTPRGREDARRIGRWLAQLVGTIDLALVSPAVRAQQTWEAAGEVFPSTAMQSPASFYAADPDDMLRLAQAAEADTVAVVAHNPGLQALALQLIRAAPATAAVRTGLNREFQPGAAIVFVRSGDGVLAARAFQTPTALTEAADA